MTIHVPPRHYYSPWAAEEPPRKAFASFIKRHWRPCGTILDVGAASGQFTQAFGAQTSDSQLIALDHNCELLKLRPKGVAALTADFNTSLPLKTESIDAAILSFSLHLARDQDHLLLEISRCLRPQGKLFILTCSEANLSGRFLNRFLPQLKEKDWLRYRGITHLRKALKNSNFGLRAIENIRLGQTAIDNEYIATLKTRTWSSILLFKESEITHCLNEIRLLAQYLTDHKRSLIVPWIRTAIFAHKMHESRGI